MARTVSNLMGPTMICYSRWTLQPFAYVLLAALFFTGSTHGQLANFLLESWEGGVGNWTSNISNGAQVMGGATLGTSANGATNGASSLSVTQHGDTLELDPLFNSVYSYDAEVRYLPGDPQLDDLNSAFNIGATHFELQLDVTYVDASIPGGNRIRSGIGLEGGGAPFNTQEGLADFNLNFMGQPSQTFTIAKPLDDWTVPQLGNATFFDVSFGLNGNWGASDATVFFDNLRLVQVSEPSILALEIDRDTGATRILNEAGANTVAFDYYEITSPNGALDPVGWQSLDDSLMPDEGWTAAGGASQFDLTEANLLSFSDLNGGESFSLGTAFQVGGNEAGLSFRYREPSRPGVLVDGDLLFLGDPPTSCDFDGSMTCDGTDIDMLMAAIASGANDPAFDLNGDNNVNLIDRDIWLADAGNMNVGGAYLVADFNLDGFVNGQDFVIWNTNKFTTNTAWTDGNSNGDSDINGQDFVDWNSNKFMSSTDNLGAVPEPTTAWQLVILVALLAAGTNRWATNS